jgi:tetratricopeptide (TPR) repeat protein
LNWINILFLITVASTQLIYAQIDRNLVTPIKEPTALEFSERAAAFYDYYIERSDELEKQESLMQTIIHAQKAIQKDPTLAQPHGILGMLNASLHQWENAITELKEAVRLDPYNVQYVFELGKVWYKTKRFNEARQSFETVCYLNPRSENAWYNLGGTLRALAKPEEALTAFQKAIDLNPDYAPAHREIGNVRILYGDFTGAIESYTRALQIQSADSSSLRGLGMAYCSLEQWNEAESVFNRMFYNGDQDATVFYNRAVVLLNLKENPEQALDYAKTAASLVPLNAMYAYTLGLAYEATHDREGAIAAYTKAALLDRNLVQARINLGYLYIEQELFDHAFLFLNEAYRLAPDSAEVNNNLGSVYAAQEQWTKSIEHYEKALRVQPTNTAVRLNLAHVLVESGDFTRAIRVYREIIKTDSTNIEVQIELGKTLITNGYYQEAQQYLTALIKQNPTYKNIHEVEAMVENL